MFTFLNALWICFWIQTWIACLKSCSIISASLNYTCSLSHVFYSISFISFINLISDNHVLPMSKKFKCKVFKKSVFWYCFIKYIIINIHLQFIWICYYYWWVNKIGYFRNCIGAEFYVFRYLRKTETKLKIR